MYLKFFASCLLILLCTFQTKAQDLDSLMKISAFTEESDLQKILNKNVTVSSRKALATRETPGIISLITAEEIENSGARDLVDVLRLVPGFDVAQDVQFVQGIGFRGNWANEGKVLVMVDGQPYNDLLYQSTAIGNRFAVNMIERIEIIRGPGSAVYGGSAEYGVINIITKGAESLNGVLVSGTVGVHSNALGRASGGVSIAQRGNVNWDATIFRGKGNMSNASYQDLYQDADVQELSKTTKADPLNLNVGLSHKGLSVRTIYDEYKTGDPFLFVNYKNLFTDIRYEAKLSDKITLTPEFRYTNQTPWAWGDRSTGEYTFKVKAERLYGSLTSSYDITRKLNVIAGAVYFSDSGTDLLQSNRYDGTDNIKLTNYALFAQGLLKHRLANITAGFRYERNNRYGDAFVPRLALTKKIENLHFKVLFSQAFRAPSIENINIAEGGTIKPEKSNVFEAELGYQFTPETVFSVNAFSLSTNNVIIYQSESISTTETVEYYKNFDRSGTHGLEAQYSLRKKKWYVNASYSFSRANGNNTVDIYTVPQTSKVFVGFPASKVTVNSSFKIVKELSFSPSMIYGSKRYAYNAIDSDGNPVSNELNSYVLLNAFFNYKNIVKGLTLGAGVYDLFNQRPPIAQAYNGDYAPIPGRSREYVFKLSYQLDFKK